MFHFIMFLMIPFVYLLHASNITTIPTIGMLQFGMVITLIPQVYIGLLLQIISLTVHVVVIVPVVELIQSLMKVGS